MRRFAIGFSLAYCLIHARLAFASTVTADTLSVGTVTAQSSSNGLMILAPIRISTDKSLILRGAGGYLTTNSSITASAFFGDGSSLTGIGAPLLVATNTFTGANTFTSSITVRTGGRQITFSTSTTANNLNIDRQGVVSFSPELHNSSHTLIPSYFTNRNNLGPCVTGSTVTITTAGGIVEITFAGYIQKPSSAGLGFLRDGAFVDNFNSTRAVIYLDDTSNGFENASFDYFVASSPGTHSFCLTLGLGNGVSFLQLLDGVLFYVKELK